MKRHIPGLHGEGHNSESILEGVFLVRVDRVFYRWHPERPFYVLRLSILEPSEHQGRSLNGRLYCTPKALWKLRWFLRTLATTPTSWAKTKSMKRHSLASEELCGFPAPP